MSDRRLCGGVRTSDTIPLQSNCVCRTVTSYLKDSIRQCYCLKEESNRQSFCLKYMYVINCDLCNNVGLNMRFLKNKDKTVNIGMKNVSLQHILSFRYQNFTDLTLLILWRSIRNHASVTSVVAVCKQFLMFWLKFPSTVLFGQQ